MFKVFEMRNRLHNSQRDGRACVATKSVFTESSNKVKELPDSLRKCPTWLVLICTPLMTKNRTVDGLLRALESGTSLGDRLLRRDSRGPRLDDHRHWLLTVRPVSDEPVQLLEESCQQL